MIKFKITKLLTTALIAIFVTVSCFNVSAFAAVAYSPEKNVTVYGTSYTYYSGVETDSTKTYGKGMVKTANSVPTGYIGINARLYNDSGTLVSDSGIIYNEIALIQMSRSTMTTTTGTYYAQSQMHFYNGNGYSKYTSNATPRVQRSLVQLPLNKPYEVNENGLTYGSDFYAESLKDNPDLIRVIGMNGVEGYVYSKDINLELNTLEQVLDYINSGQSNYTVPVYKENGSTVVDTFEINSEI